MTRQKITDDMRTLWDERAEWPHTFNTLLVRKGRLYMRLPTYHPSNHRVEVDVTPLYHYLKEMFTTDWQDHDTK